MFDTSSSADTPGKAKINITRGRRSLYNERLPTTPTEKRQSESVLMKNPEYVDAVKNIEAYENYLTQLRGEDEAWKQALENAKRRADDAERLIDTPLEIDSKDLDLTLEQKQFLTARTPATDRARKWAERDERLHALSRDLDEHQAFLEQMVASTEIAAKKMTTIAIEKFKEKHTRPMHGICERFIELGCGDAKEADETNNDSDLCRSAL